MIRKSHSIPAFKFEFKINHSIHQYIKSCSDLMISSEILDETNEIIEIQDILLNLSSKNLNTVKIALQDSPYLRNDKNIQNFLNIILIFSEIRVQKIKFYCEILAFLNQKIVSIKQILFDFFFKPSNCDGIIYINAHRFNFLRHCMITGLYTSLEIVERIETYVNARSPEYFYLSTMFCYFAPEIQRVKPSLYSALFEIFEKEMQMMTSPTFLFEAYSNWEDLSKNNFELYIKSFETENFIKTDSIEQLIPSISDINQRISPTIFGQPPFLQNFPTLIECAAFYGSIKCFKYFLLNHANLTLNDQMSRTLVHFAIAGGNIEIVRILDQQNLNFDCALHIAATFHQHELFLWLIENGKCTIDGRTLCNAAMKANLKDILYMFENNINPNLPAPLGWTSLHYAANYNVISSLKLLLSHNDINPNVNNNGNFTPLDEAVSNGQYEAVEILISDPRVEINMQANDGIFFAYW